MNLRVTAAFTSEISAMAAARELAKVGIQSNVGKSWQSLQIQFNPHELAYKKRGVPFGLAGTVLGCIIGFVLVPHVPERQMMYPVILPMTTTYLGLALGLFSAMVLRRLEPVLQGKNVATMHLTGTNGGVAFLTAQANTSAVAARARGILSTAGATTIVTERSSEFRTMPVDRLALETLLSTSA
jgi:hypothetical protein